MKKYGKELALSYTKIIGYSSLIFIITAFIMLFPLIIVLFYPEDKGYFLDFLIPAIASLTIGGLLNKAFMRSANDPNREEGWVFVLAAWMIAPMLSAIPFVSSGQLTMTQAIFESMSGWTTTGLSVIDVTNVPHIFLFWRSLMQFFGGIGLVVVLLSALMGPQSILFYNAEGRSDRLFPNLVSTARTILLIYSMYVISGTALYVMSGMSWFEALNHSICALSTGGFSTNSLSIGAYGSMRIELITILLMLLGTTNFGAHMVLLKGQFKKFFELNETTFLFGILCLFIPLMAFCTLNDMYGTLNKGMRVAVFEAVSALTTTGYSTVSYSSWNSASVFMMIILMLIGGGFGSTAGGIKLYRVDLLLRACLWSIKKTFMPEKVVMENSINRPEGRLYVSSEHISEAAQYIVLYLVTFVIGALIIMACGYSFQDSMFEFASALGTVGLSVGITTANAPPAVLWVEIIGMFVGRLEFYVIIYALMKIVKDIRYIVIGK